MENHVNYAGLALLFIKVVPPKSPPIGLFCPYLSNSFLDALKAIKNYCLQVCNSDLI